MLCTTSASVGRGRNRHCVPGLALLASFLFLDGAHAADDPGKRGEVYARFMRAVLAEQHGDYREAASEVRRATETMPRTPEVLVEGARLLSRMGRLEDAEALAERALAIDAEDRDALMLLADAAATRAIRAGKSDAENRDRALGFYERLGYVAYGPEFADAGMPHRAMRREV